MKTPCCNAKSTIHIRVTCDCCGKDVEPENVGIDIAPHYDPPPADVPQESAN